MPLLTPKYQPAAWIKNGHLATIYSAKLRRVNNLSGLPMGLSEQEVSDYRKGSQVTANVGQTEVDLLRKQLFSLLDKTRADYNKGLFSRYKEYTVSTGTTLSNVDEAIEFNNFHEGLHLGYVMAIKRALGY